jgi:hypothetical protein
VTVKSLGCAGSYCGAQNSGAECWALFFCALRWSGVSPVRLRNPKMYVVNGAGASLSGWNGGIAGVGGRWIQPSVPPQ